MAPVEQHAKGVTQHGAQQPTSQVPGIARLNVFELETLTPLSKNSFDAVAQVRQELAARFIFILIPTASWRRIRCRGR